MFIEWYLNEYRCERCLTEWEDEWSCMCDDRCPNCDLEHAPYRSTDHSRLPDREDYVYAARRLEQTEISIVDPDQVVLKPGGAFVGTSVWVTEVEAVDYAQHRLEGD